VDLLRIQGIAGYDKKIMAVKIVENPVLNRSLASNGVPKQKPGD
jgi:hypothetical protein